MEKLYEVPECEGKLSGHFLMPQGLPYQSEGCEVQECLVLNRVFEPGKSFPIFNRIAVTVEKASLTVNLQFIGRCVVRMVDGGWWMVDGLVIYYC